MTRWVAWVFLVPTMMWPSEECGRCHQAQAKTHRATSMAKALERVEECEILKSNPSLTFKSGEYQYSIRREGARSTYTVTNGRETISVPIGWAFGLGAAGQTYVFERNGTQYESRVSFFKKINGLDLTMGVNDSPARDIGEAAGREMTRRDSADCFGCHSAGGVRDGSLHVETMAPGVQCANCHVGGEKHAAAVERGDPKAGQIARLKSQNAEETSELCGKCHRTWADIAANGPRGIGNVRFQPYRLANSKCYDALDARIRCTACHDPHSEAETRPTAYDAKCRSCHAPNVRAAAKPSRLCRVSTTGCVTCHMPKYEIPGSHHQFSDHQIRIVRNHEPYPN